MRRLYDFERKVVREHAQRADYRGQSLRMKQVLDLRSKAAGNRSFGSKCVPKCRLERRGGEVEEPR